MVTVPMLVTAAAATLLAALPTSWLARLSFHLMEMFTWVIWPTVVVVMLPAAGALLEMAGRALLISFCHRARSMEAMMPGVQRVVVQLSAGGLPLLPVPP